MSWLRSLDSDSWFVKNRNAHRRGDEAHVVGGLVQLESFLLVASGRESHRRPERHALEFAAAIGAHHHGAARVILVGDNVDLAARAECEVRQQMTRRQRGDEEIFRIVDVGVATENRVGAPGQIRLAIELDAVLSPVPRVGRSAGAEVAVPDQLRFVVVRVLSSGGFRHVRLLQEFRLG